MFNRGKMRRALIKAYIKIFHRPLEHFKSCRLSARTLRDLLFNHFTPITNYKLKYKKIKNHYFCLDKVICNSDVRCSYISLIAKSKQAREMNNDKHSYIIIMHYIRYNVSDGNIISSCTTDRKLERRWCDTKYLSDLLTHLSH